MEFDDEDIGGCGEDRMKSLDQPLADQVLQGLVGGLRRPVILGRQDRDVAVKAVEEGLVAEELTAAVVDPF